MPSPLAIAQFARLAGRVAVLTALNLPPEAPLPLTLTDPERERLRRLASAHTDRIATALWDEAAHSDDVQDSASALAYVEERLTSLAPLLEDHVCATVRAFAAASAARWKA